MSTRRIMGNWQAVHGAAVRRERWQIAFRRVDGANSPRQAELTNLAKDLAVARDGGNLWQTLSIDDLVRRGPKGSR